MRTDIQKRFIEAFASDDFEQPMPSREDLTRVEKSLGVTFPQAYIDFLTTYGAVRTPSILNLVTGGESEDPPDNASFDIQEFFCAEQIEETARVYWSAGMDETLVPIASDCMGNVFGFTRTQHKVRPDDQPVLVFDHDFVTISEEAASFNDWLDSFLAMSNGPKAEQADTRNRLKPVPDFLDVPIRNEIH